MDRDVNDAPYQQLDTPNPRGEWPHIGNADKGGNGSTCDSNGSIEDPTRRLVDHTGQQQRHFDLSSDVGDGSVGTSTCIGKGGASTKSVSFWVSFSAVLAISSKSIHRSSLWCDRARRYSAVMHTSTFPGASSRNIVRLAELANRTSTAVYITTKYAESLPVIILFIAPTL